MFQVYGERFHNQQLGGWLKQRHGERVGNHGMGTLSGSEHPRPLVLPNCKSNLQGPETGGAQSQAISRLQETSSPLFGPEAATGNAKSIAEREIFL